MGGARAASGSGRRRGGGRAVGLCCLTALAALALVACGGGGEADLTAAEKAADAEVLNESLARELTLLDAYTRGGRVLRGRLRVVDRKLRAQQQEYADALVKALRGLGAEVDAEPGELELNQGRGREDFLLLVYDLESAALAAYLEAATQLFNAAPRRLAASLAAGHAQHLVLIRQGLGADLGAAAPEAFDGGVVPPPGAPLADRE